MTAEKTAPHREFTFRAVALGSLLGIVFGLVTVYVALEVGLNFSASIPISVLSITVFKYIGRPTLLENNMVQTVGSAGESIAAGVVYTIPALLFLGYQLEIWRIFWLSLIGGILGVLFMIPLRHQLIVEEHRNLAYPEGTACANILLADERGGRFARHVFLGLLVGLADKFLMSGLRLWRSAVEWSSTGLRGAALSLDFSPELLGIGCLIGLPIARILFAGSVMSSLILVPLIYFFGEGLAAPLYPSAAPIGQMTPSEIWSNYLRYVGAGAVIAGGARLLVGAIPTVFRSLRVHMRRQANAAPAFVSRTEDDMPLTWVALAAAATLAALYVLLAWKINAGGSANLTSVVLVAIFGLFFVVVSARITGLMGSSANPISGMTIAVLMLTCLIFVAAGWVNGTYEIIAISIGAVVCVASSNAGTTAQDLKTGYLVGATPRWQQIGLLAGVLTSVLVIGFTLRWLNDSSAKPTPIPPIPAPTSSIATNQKTEYDGQQYDIVAVRVGTNLAPGRYLISPSDGMIHFRENQHIGSAELPAPQAQVMAILVEGLLNGRMRWRLLLIGICIALMVEFCGIRSLPFAVGTYLPISVTAAMLVGAIIGHAALSRRKTRAEDIFEPSILFSSGLIAGGAIAAIAIAILSNFGLAEGMDFGHRAGFGFLQSAVWALFWFGVLAWLLWRESRSTG